MKLHGREKVKHQALTSGLVGTERFNACLGRFPPRQKSRVGSCTSHRPSLEAAERSKFLASPRSQVIAPRMSSLQPSRDTNYAVLAPVYM
jgi:hypothetical protein